MNWHSEAGKKGAAKTKIVMSAKIEKSKNEYYLSPRKCTICQSIIAYEKRRWQKFCTHKCAAISRNNVNKNYRTRTATRCKHCDKIIKVGRTVCRKYEKELEVESGAIDKRGTLRYYLLNKRGHFCEICKGESWFGRPMPLEVDHIDGNASNNFPINVRLICPNCHTFTSTFKGRNKRNGRKVRNLPHH